MGRITLLTQLGCKENEIQTTVSVVWLLWYYLLHTPCLSCISSAVYVLTSIGCSRFCLHWTSKAPRECAVCSYSINRNTRCVDVILGLEQCMDNVLWQYPCVSKTVCQPCCHIPKWYGPLARLPHKPNVGMLIQTMGVSRPHVQRDYPAVCHRVCETVRSNQYN